MAFKDLFTKSEDGASTGKEPVAPVNPRPVSAQIHPAEQTNINVDSVAHSDAVVSSGVVETAQAPADNENIKKKLWEAILAANIPGPDFIELKAAASSLVDMGFTVEKRYEAAFKMLRSSYPDLSKDTILKSIDLYKNVINTERENGLKQCDEKQKREIGERETRAKQLRDRAAEIKVEIDKLNSEYQKVCADAGVIESEVSQMTASLNEEKNVFCNSVQSVLTSLDKDKDVVNNLNV
jgi:hypothetical protein